MPIGPPARLVSVRTTDAQLSIRGRVLGSDLSRKWSLIFVSSGAAAVDGTLLICFAPANGRHGEEYGDESESSDQAEDPPIDFDRGGGGVRWRRHGCAHEHGQRR